MKKFITLLLVIATFGVSAESGSSLVSHIYSVRTTSSNYAWNFIYLTNITDTNVRVSISMYREDGTLISDVDNNSSAGLLKASNVTAYNDVDLNNSMSFTLDPKVTTRVWLDNPSSTEIIGYALVKWVKDGIPMQSEALIGHAVAYRAYNGVGYYSVPINDGKPF
ncbi:hypothetical protein A5320_11590 [Rheinheimera sp. SA_1]|uniref:hypothetical protein n=1 Tax=Rheinheimera sp. SA_1 TaxID=1827365 RepID=UPI0008015EF1|nr:hypothetical protein [Rheinheimera sp. SA_1]OBP14412.1 hypothetical protein A5320_11590 [Rheinheimera sp. SA_1]